MTAPVIELPRYPTDLHHETAHPRHPLGTRARVLLCSVFGPFAQDDEYGSRKMNPMELYQNQVTREQGVFSLRMFHRSWGIMLIQCNISAPCSVLDFPSLDRFTREIADGQYDVVGITSIIPNVGKVKKMCDVVREHAPSSTIVIGGHVTNLPDIGDTVDADHVVRGEGVSWMRRFLGEDDRAPIQHPRVLSGINARTLGLALRDKPGDVAATLIPTVGCPLGCNFCATSAMFGGKGRCFHFYETGDELFRVMCDLEEDLKVNSFFVMDENFLIYRKRALRLLQLMEAHGKSWSLYVFSSLNVLQTYSVAQIVGLGISWVWVGIEGENTVYRKLKNVDTKRIVHQLQSHGVRVLGSTIIGLEHHTPETMDRVIDFAVDHDTEFHQFMLYTPLPGTPLYAEHESDGTLLSLDEVPHADAHGQERFRHQHPAIPRGAETEMIQRAFQRDFEVNGPSIVRVGRTMLRGWRRYKNHPDPRIRARFTRENEELPLTYAAMIWSARRWFRHSPRIHQRLSELLTEFYREFGLRTRLGAPLVGRYLRLTMKREARRLRRGLTLEPPTFFESNAFASTIVGA